MSEASPLPAPAGPVPALLVGLAEAEGGLSTAVAAPLWPLGDAEVVAALAAAQRVAARLLALQARLVGEVDARGCATAAQAPSTAVWLRQRFACSGPAAVRAVAQAAALDRHPAVATALAAGEIGTEQATVACAVLDRLPPSDPDRAAAAAELLVEQAGQLDPAGLARAGQALVETLTTTPSSDDPAEAAALARAADARDAQAAAAAGLHLRTRPGGALVGTLRLDPVGAATLLAALDPLAQPRPDPDGSPDGRPLAARRADALVELAGTALAAGGLPDRGGTEATLTVTTPWAALAQATTGAVLDHGGALGPTQLRQLACDARILPAVLAGPGQPVDLGRATRTWSPSLRRALALRDGGCTAPGCDRPPAACHAHHLRHWADGGPTTLANGTLLCRHHHQQVHRHGWTITLAPNGYPQFHPPPALDPTGTPRQHHRFALRRLARNQN